MRKYKTNVIIAVLLDIDIETKHRVIAFKRSLNFNIFLLSINQSRFINIQTKNNNNIHT